MYLSSVQQENLMLETKEQPNFDRNSKKSALSEKEHPKITEKYRENIN